MGDQFPLSKEEFDSIYAKVPRLSVEVLVVDDDKGVYLTKRAIEPCKGQWHLPGGTVLFGEPLSQAVHRIAARELGLDVTVIEPFGYIEYPSHYKHGLDHPVGLVFKVLDFSGTIEPNAEADGGGWFKAVPENMHADQNDFLINNNLISVT